VSALAEVMRDSGLWEDLLSDAAGRQLLDVLRLNPHSQPELAGMALAERRMDLTEFTSWIDQVLEATSFVPQAPPVAEVVILPLSQMLGRPFAALVLAGCDEQTLPGSAPPPGEWTARQRQQLGMPSREQLAQVQRSAWDQALTVGHVDLLRRSQDSAGETLLASPLLQRWILQGAVVPAGDPQDYRSLELRPVPRPMPQGDWLPVHRVSASAYADLRSCPYRFFALRQLGLQEIDEIESELDKRDFGLWLHAVLKQFHDQAREQGVNDPAGRRQLIDACAQAVRASMVLDEAQFLPFMVSWPSLRDGYLRWLEEHQFRLQACYTDGERPCQTPLGDLTLVGKIDRIDTLPDGTVLLIDYKTESRQTTQNRVGEPLEDTQLPFYAALLPDDTLRALYLNLSEREGSKAYEMEDVVQARDALLQGLISDFARLNEGVRLAALGEGSVCEYCVARGLCRKDSWA
jgi:ATP-dependent helicase/nuclease subunit B